MPSSLFAALLLLSASPRVPSPAPRPESLREFAGFLLGQYARNVEAKLGKPTSVETDTDGESLWNYELAPKEGTVLTFSVSKAETPLVTMIELSGVPKAGLPDLRGVTLGTPKAEVISRFGAPDTMETRKETPGEELDWQDRNQYVELDAAGKVDRIQVVDNVEGYAKMGDTKPDLAGFQRALQGRNPAEILDWLCADIDVYTKTDDTVGFVGKPREDLLDESSLIARYVYGGTGSTRDLLTPALVGSAEEERDPEDEREWNSTFPDGSPILQIVWWFEAGRWRVWEIHLEEDEALLHRTRSFIGRR